MKINEKLDYLQSNHWGEWMKVRGEAEDDLSSKQSMFCVCRRLATGLHERHCKRFQGKVNAEVVKRLAHLLPKITLPDNPQSK